MSTAVYDDDGTDIKSEFARQEHDIIVILNHLGLCGVCVFAPLSFLTTCIWIRRCDLLDLVWGGMGIHMALNSGAFLLLGPMASIVYRLLHDYYCVNKKLCMKVHGWVQLAATVIGIIGVRAVYVAHCDSALAYIEDGSYYVYHFRSSHSILGIFALGIYTAQLVVAAYIYGCCTRKDLRASYKQLHMAVGQGLIVVMLYVCALGMMYFESEAYNLDWDDVGLEGHYRPVMTVAQYFIVFLMFSIILVFYAKLLV